MMATRHKMSLVGARSGGQGSSMSDVFLGGDCTVSSNASWLMITWEPPVNRQTGTSENITFLQVCWQLDVLRKIMKYQRNNMLSELREKVQ